MNKIRNYFLKDLLAKSNDPFEIANTLLLFRLVIFFIVCFSLPILSDYILGYYKAMVLHVLALLAMCTFPFILKKQQNTNRSVNTFFIVASVISTLTYMVFANNSVDAINMGWLSFFVLLSIILQKGWVRILFCFFINWIPIIYLVINHQLNGALNVPFLLEETASDPPIVLALIPLMLIVYSVWDKTNTIEKAQQTISYQKKIIDEKNKDIIDSIQYAKRLQEALLPSTSDIENALTDHFIFYLPKDIVAGDFYWFEKNQDFAFIAAADCTGHGVPGAMMSVLCSGALSRSIKEFKLSETHEILNKTSELVREAFVKNKGDVKDGMDISILRLNHKTKQIQWSGANNSLWYINKGELKEIKADKQHIGYNEKQLTFSNHNFHLPDNSMLYLFTDGMADQFGGEKGKKYKYKKLQQTLLDIHTLPCQQQNQKLKEEFNRWKGNHEQVDDVCIIGIKTA
ncbi:MAG: SpoIIE family protein phosphatase [Sphingobacteriaceae bacterium]|nr:SpoIIE family protein phosphatase [Sphingobacteriaceae bacterium]